MTLASLETLLRERPDIRRGGRPNSGQAGRPSGYAPLDEALPDGGWPANAVTELLIDRPGIGELSLLLPLLRTLTAVEGRDVALVAPPHTPHAPALANAGLSLGHLLVVDPPTPADALWATERLLRSGRYGAVLLWARRTTPARQRRLQLAASEGASIGIVYRTMAEAGDHSPVALRLGLNVVDGALRIEPVKARGGAGRPVALNPALFDEPQGAPWPVASRAPAGPAPRTTASVVSISAR